MKLQNLILQKIAELGEVVLDGFFPEKYPEARLWRGLLNAGSSYKFSRQTFSTILSRLRREGFVEKRNGRKNALWRLTRKGIKFLDKQDTLAEQDKVKPISDGITRVICFDIPETQRKKRRWIREELLGLGYQSLQKSVWIGFTPLPEDFFEDLDILYLRDHIHIFSVAKKGTIEKLIV